MNLYLIGHDYRYAVEQMLLTLFPDERPEYPDGRPTGDRVELRLMPGPKITTATCVLVYHGRTANGRTSVPNDELTDPTETDRRLQGAVKRAFYRAAMGIGLPHRPWGMLTGVRPGKLMTPLLAQGMGDAQAMRYFERHYDVAPARAALVVRTAHATLRAMDALGEKDVCLYVGIPFCPTRCAYCSFVSQSVEKSMALVPEFLQALAREIAATAEAVQRAGLRIVSLYIGCGTPTTLSARQLDALCTQLAAAFDLSALREFTVEAGRPDTITADKLQVLRAHRVDRISVNPQTLDDRVLDTIGRRHTAQDIYDALRLVRETGGFAVNMDLIAGLPGDTPDGFRATLEQVLALAPENVTVHTLSRKRGADLMTQDAASPTGNRSARCSTLPTPRSTRPATRRITSTGRSSCPAGLKTSAGRGRGRRISTTSASWRSCAASLPWAAAPRRSSCAPTAAGSSGTSTPSIPRNTSPISTASARPRRNWRRFFNELPHSGDQPPHSD